MEDVLCSLNRHQSIWYGNPAIISFDIQDKRHHSLKTKSVVYNLEDSVSESALKFVYEHSRSYFGRSPKKLRKVIILDSHHTEDHVFNELINYDQFCKKGDYMIVCDTIVDNKYYDHKNREREWNAKNNPMTALKKFLEIKPHWKQDEEVDASLLLSCNKGGYIQYVG